MKINKKVVLSLGLITASTIPSLAVVSCGNHDKKVVTVGGNKSSWDGVSLKRKEENLSKINRKITRKLVKPFGDAKWIKKLEDQNFKKFFADQKFIRNNKSVFQRSPRTILSNTPQVKDIKDLNAKIFGMEELKEFVNSNNGTLNISLIEGTEDDSTGTLGVKTTMIFDGNKKVVAEYTVDGFAITKDIEMDGNNFTSITSIINALNKETDLDFEKKVAIMSPQDLKNELIDLYNKTYGGRLTIIGKYNGKTSAIALDRNNMLNDLINAFGDVSKTKRYEGGWQKLGMSILTHPGEIKVGNLVTLFAKYSQDLPSEADKDDVAGLLGNLPAGVMNMFPDLLKLFSQVANGVKEMPMVVEWARKTYDNTTGKTYEQKIKTLDHILVRWVLKTGNWK